MKEVVTVVFRRTRQVLLVRMHVVPATILTCFFTEGRALISAEKKL